MAIALEEAAEAGRAGDVPVGAVLVDPEGRVLCRGRNRRETDGDPTAHAEIVVLRRGAEVRGEWHLDGHTLYVTKEPCPMCAGALVNARIARLVFGCRDPKGGAAVSLYRIPADERLNHRVEIRADVLGAEARALLQRFFRERRHGSMNPQEG